MSYQYRIGIIIIVGLIFFIPISYAMATRMFITAHELGHMLGTLLSFNEIITIQISDDNGYVVTTGKSQLSGMLGILAPTLLALVIMGENIMGKIVMILTAWLGLKYAVDNDTVLAIAQIMGILMMLTILRSRICNVIAGLTLFILSWVNMAYFMTDSNDMSNLNVIWQIVTIILLIIIPIYRIAKEPLDE